MDARRISDGIIVTLKQLDKTLRPEEVELIEMFSAEPRATDTRDYRVPVSELLQSPLVQDLVFFVVPHLMRYDSPRFYAVGEAVDCFRELIQGSQFLHQHHVAHRDISTLNVMMDYKGFISERHTLSLTSVPATSALQKGPSLDSMKPLIADMVQAEPTKRPTMDQGSAIRKDCRLAQLLDATLADRAQEE
ncbi:hypothetical protein C8Q77DRAFT_1157496 [Trametes polyzona]|nr:hypothetical protein C8Q77DRAFT_1157496 [Trametes polyzona]